MRKLALVVLLALLAGGCSTIREFIDRHIIEGRAGDALAGVARDR